MIERIDEFPKLPVALPLFCVYVDGYNFYGAINHLDPEWLYGLGWCNFHKLGAELSSRTFDVPQKWFDLPSKYFICRGSRLGLSFRTGTSRSLAGGSEASVDRHPNPGKVEDAPSACCGLFPRQSPW